MPLGEFQEAGAIPRPLIIGRAVRFAFGIGAGFYFIWLLINYQGQVSSDFPISGYWVGVGFAWWYLSDLTVVGFSRPWRRWPQVAASPGAPLFAINLVQ